MVGLALVALALILAAWRFFSGADLVDQLLAVAIVGNIVLFVITSAGAEGPHEIAVVAPFGAALAARMLARAQAPAGRPARPAARRARAAGYAAGAAGPARLPGRPGPRGGPARRRAARRHPVASWLQAHHLRYGLGGYWESSIITVETGGQVKVRALLKSTPGAGPVAGQALVV